MLTKTFKKYLAENVKKKKNQSAKLVIERAKTCHRNAV